MVNVLPGAYYENIQLKRFVQIHGAGADTTTLVGLGNNSVITAQTVTETTIIRGLTITGGTGREIDDGWGTITRYGGAVFCSSIGSPTFINCVFCNNSADYGGGIYTISSAPNFINCTFSDNSANEKGAVIYSTLGYKPTFTNCILWDQPTAPVKEIEYDWYEAAPLVTCCDVYLENASSSYFGAGNINQDPQFTDTGPGGFHISNSSPCIDAGYNGAMFLPDTDFEGQLRVCDGNFDQIPVCDIGADELIQSGYVPPALVWVDDNWAATAIIGADPDGPGPAERFGYDSFGTIQEAIGAVAPGGTVRVLAGAYDERLYLRSGVAVIGAGIDLSIIDRNYTDTGATFVFTNADTRLEGFTLSRCKGSLDGGGAIFMLGADSTIANCALRDNQADAFGGGMRCWFSSPLIYNVEFTRNLTGLNTQGYGSGLSCRESTAMVVNCIFTRNEKGAGDHEHFGAAIYSELSTCTILNGTFYRNTANSGGGSVYSGLESDLTITNSILWRNLPDEIVSSSEKTTVSYSNVYQTAGLYPGDGNINADPLYTDANNGDFRLKVGSPCIDTGLDAAVPIWLTWDFQGDQRKFDYPEVPTPDHAQSVDMGADELVIHALDVTTAPLTDLTDISALGGGSVSSPVTVEVTERGLCFNTIGNPTIADETVTAGSGLGDFTAPLDTLTPNTTYYVKAYAIQSDLVFYGESITFKTHGPPLITTDEVTDIDATQALCTATITDENGAAISERGICWNLSGDPDINDNIIFDQTDTARFSCHITGLDPNTTCYVRGWASNACGTGYGTILEFTTSEFPTTVWVDDDFSPDPADNDGHTWQFDAFNNIQQAISAVNKPGGAVHINPGVYYENILLTNDESLLYNDLQLIGAGPHNTIIDGGCNNPVLTLQAVSSCTIQGLTLRNGSGRSLQDNPDLAEETYGGGLFLATSSPVVLDCIFEQNSATVHGGAIFGFLGSYPFINRCIFRHNTAGLYGGAICNYAAIVTGDQAPEISNCLFTDNQAVFGGAIANDNSYFVTINSCTFTSNHVVPLPGVYENNTGGALFNAASLVNLYNSIIWANDPNQIESAAGSITTVQYCDVQGGYGTTEDHNIDLDPQFTSLDSLQPAPGSPVIDAGNNDLIPDNITTDLTGYDRIADGNCDNTILTDMGAYELNFARSGDCDGDCDIDLADFDTLSNSWYDDTCNDCPADINDDQSVDLIDLYIQAANWLLGVQ